MVIVLLFKKNKHNFLLEERRSRIEPCVVNLLIVGAACRVTIDENREPKFLILSIVALLFDVVAPFIVAREGMSVAEKLIRF